MSRSRIKMLWAAIGIVAVVLSTSVAGQAAGKIPVISGRTYVSGSAKVTVTGAFQVNADIPINTKASFSDGEMTWLQFGDSGAETPNLLLTVSAYEVGFGIGLGKKITTAGAEDCTGDLKVSASLIAGQYSCAGVTSYDPRDGQMGKVDIEIHITAGS